MHIILALVVRRFLQILEHVEELSATCTNDGNDEYYKCSACDKYFTDALGTLEIADKSSVVRTATIDRLPYAILEGNSQTFAIDSSKDITIRANGTFEIYIDYESDKATDSDYEYSFKDSNLLLKGIKATMGTYTLTKQ